MKGNKIAVRYAKALFSLAKNDAELEKMKLDVDNILTVCKNRDFRAMLNSPVIKSVKKETIFKEIFESTISPITLEFLNMLIENTRENQLVEIGNSFYDLYNKHKSIMIVHVNSAVALSEIERNKIIELVKNHTRSDVVLKEVVDSKLIGGFILRFDDKQLDNSVSNQLEKVKQQLTQKIN